MEQKPTNNVHLNGYVNQVSLSESEKSAIIVVATRERYNNENHYTYNTVSVALDKESAKTVKAIKADLEENLENRDNKEYKPKRHTMAVDGALVVRERETEDAKYYNPIVVAREVKFDGGLGENEVRNFGEFKGNIAKINKGDKFATIDIATHYFAPDKEAEKGYSEKTTYVRTQVNKARMGELFDKLESGEIAVGDLVEARGQLHNDNYKDKNGVYRANIRVDISKFELIAKKKVAEAQTQEAKKDAKEAKAEKPAKKAASRRRV